MNITGELFYKFLLIKMLKEKLREKKIDNIHEITNQVFEKEKEVLHKDIEQMLKEINDYYEIMDKFILSDNEMLEESGAYLLEKLNFAK